MVTNSPLKKINNFLLTEPTWLSENQCERINVPQEEKTWLLEPGSLTLRLKRSFQGEFNVLVEEEGVATPFEDDARVLEIECEEAFVREVVLTINQVPLVFARTTIPKHSLDALQQLATLGNKPLGEVIFNYPELKRDSLDIVLIPKSTLSEKGRVLLADNNALWARRNAYDINGYRFVVSEFFLPNVFE